MSQIRYRPELDGLRAVAVIPVILFHLGAEYLPGGFIGVDVFFVLSGYLITLIILTQHDRNTFSLVEFWGRRVRRILPALTTMVCATSIAGSAILYKPDIHTLGQQGIASLLSFANIFFWRMTGSYWGPQAESSPLLHTWSLSVEEQFYLLFPPLLILLLKYRRTWLIPVTGTFFIGSLALFLYGCSHHPTGTFYLLPTRAWELGAGGLLAILNHRDRALKHRWLDQRGSLFQRLGLILILLSFVFISGEQGLSAWLVIPIAGAALVIAPHAQTKGPAFTVLSTPPMVYIGRISYSLYIWHWPVFLLSRNLYVDGVQVVSSLVALLATVLLSVASYHLVEQPLRQNRKFTFAILIYTAGVIAFSTYLYRSAQMEDVSDYHPTEWRGEAYDVAPHPIPTELAQKRMAGIELAARTDNQPDAFSNGGIIKRYGGDVPQMVVMGDSHALMWANTLDEIAEDLSVSISFMSANGTPAFTEIPMRSPKTSKRFSAKDRLAFHTSKIRFLEEWRPRVIVIIEHWAAMKDLTITQDLMALLAEMNTRVLLIEQPPELFFGDRNAPQYLAHMNLLPLANAQRYLPMAESAKYREGAEKLRQLASQHAHCELIRIADIYQQDDEVWVLDGLDVLYTDDDHLSYRGASKAKERIAQSVRAALSEQD